MSKAKGYNTSGKGSDHYLSPSGPYTGDGVKRRKIYDGVHLVFQVVTGKGKDKK